MAPLPYPLVMRARTRSPVPIRERKLARRPPPPWTAPVAVCRRMSSRQPGEQGGARSGGIHAVGPVGSLKRTGEALPRRQRLGDLIILAAQLPVPVEIDRRLERRGNTDNHPGSWTANERFRIDRNRRPTATITASAGRQGIRPAPHSAAPACPPHRSQKRGQELLSFRGPVPLFRELKAA